MNIEVNFLLGKSSGALVSFINELQKTLKSMGLKVDDADLNALKNSFVAAGEEATKLKDGMKGIEDSVTNMGAKASAADKAFKFNNIMQQSQAVANALNDVIKVGADFEQSVAELSAITGKSGPQLEALAGSARELALQFGGSATDQMKSFSGILSKLGPEVADDSAALAKLAENVNILSKASGDDATTSMNAMVDSMLQMGLAGGSSADKAENSTKVINALAAGAQVGAATIPQVSEALLQAGVAAKGANLDIVDVNAALQTLAVGGKVGSEAGVSLRNVLGLMQKASGPAEEAMKNLGTSSKELGQLLTTQGLDAAVNKLREGLAGLTTDAERNVAMFEIFGTENAAAAGILVENVDLMADYGAGIEAGMAGQGSAFQQAAINMDTSQSSMSRVKAFVEDQMIGAFNALGGGVTTALGSLAQMGPQLMALSALKDVFPVKNVLEFAKSIVSKVIPSMFVQVAATEGATAAQLKFNAATLLNPWLLGGALVLAGVAAAFALLSDDTKSAEDAIGDLTTATEEYNAAAANAKAVEEGSESLKKLADEYDRLANSKEPKSQEKLAIVAAQLQAQVPGAAESIDKFDAAGNRIGTTFDISTQAVKEFADETVRAAKEAANDAFENQNDQVGAAVDTWRSLKEQVSDAKEERDDYQQLVDKAGEDAIAFADFESAGENLKDARAELGKLSKEQQQVTDGLQQYVNEQIKSGKTTEQIAKDAQLTVKEVEYLSAAFVNAQTQAAATAPHLTKIKDESAAAAVKAKELGQAFNDAKAAAADLSSASIAALAMALSEQEAALKAGNIEKAESFKQQVALYTEQARNAVANDAKLASFLSRAEALAGKTKKTTTTRTKTTRTTVEKKITDLAEEVKEILADINEDLSLTALTDEVDIALQEIVNSQADELDKLAEQHKKFEELIAKSQKDKSIVVKNQDELKNFAIGGEVYNALVEKFAREREEAVLEIFRDRLEEEQDIEQETLSRQAEDYRLQAERIAAVDEASILHRKELFALAIEAENKLNAQSALINNEPFVELLAKRKKAEEDSTKLTAEGAKGTVALLQQRRAIELQLQTELTADQRKAEEDKLQVVNDGLQKIVEAERAAAAANVPLLDAQIETQRNLIIDAGALLLQRRDLAAALLTDITAEEKEAATAQIKILDEKITVMDAATKQSAEEYVSNIIETRNKVEDNEKERAEFIYQQRVSELRRANAEAEAEEQRHIDNMNSLLGAIKASAEKAGDRLIGTREAQELKKLEALRTNDLLNEEQYEQRKTKITQQAEEEREALRARTLGIQLEADRQAAIISTERQKKNLLDELKVAEDAGRTADADILKGQLDAVEQVLKDKKSVLTGLASEMQTGLTDIFSNLIGAGLDGENVIERIKGPFKKIFGVLVGALQRLASAKITEVILGSISGWLGIPGIAASFAAKGVLEGMFNALLNPLFDRLLSFSEGSGPISTPTLAMIGDTGNPFIPERVLRDDQLEELLRRSGMIGAAALIPTLNNIVTAIERLGGRLYVDGESAVAYVNRDRIRKGLSTRK